jgi:hypothetical protein
VTHQKHLEVLQHRGVLRGRDRRMPAFDGRFVVPGAGHNQAVVIDRGNYEKEVKSFLEKIPPRGSIT